MLLYSGINVKIFICYTKPVANNNNSIANSIFYLTNKSNHPEDGS